MDKVIKWEYLVIPFNTDALVHFGLEGWELVCLDNFNMYFKRPIADREISDN